MKKRMTLLAVLVLAALLFTGCAMRTVEQMYALPRRSEEYSQLQSAVDKAMAGLSFSAPISGENQQTVQRADLDGDGVDEYLVFATGNWEKPLQVLIFTQEEDGSCVLADTIESSGMAFEQVEYAPFDDKPGCEVIIGLQVSDQVPRSVSVYGFGEGSAKQLLMVGYSKFLTCDLDQNGLRELMVLRPGEAETERGVAVLYASVSGQIERSVEVEMSSQPAQIRRILPGNLHGGQPAIFVASAADGGAISIDAFALVNKDLVNISSASRSETTVQPLLNFYVYPEDIDGDGIVELPNLIPMRPVSNWEDGEDQFLLRWFALGADGQEVDKIYTFHYFLGGWSVRLDNIWATRTSVVQGDGMYTFYVWNEDYTEAAALYSIYVFSGSSRDEDAVRNGRFTLHRTDSVTYGARLEPDAWQYGITEDYLTECFRLIRQDQRVG